MSEYEITSILQNVKEQMLSNQNSFGEPEAWVYLEDKGRSVEIVHEKACLLQNEEYYSLRLHCGEEEYENDKFHSTMGAIDTYCTATISDEQLTDGIEYLVCVNKRLRKGGYILAKKFYQAHFRGDFYSMDLGEFNSETEAKQYLRDCLKVDRLPNGTGVWSTTPEQHREDLQIIAESNRSIGLYT